MILSQSSLRDSVVSTLHTALCNRYAGNPELFGRVGPEAAALQDLPESAHFKTLVQNLPTLNSLLWIPEKVTPKGWNKSVAAFLRFSAGPSIQELPEVLRSLGETASPWKPGEALQRGVLFFLIECLCEAATSPSQDQARVLRKVSEPFTDDDDRSEALNAYTDAFLGDPSRLKAEIRGPKGDIWGTIDKTRVFIENQVPEVLRQLSWMPQGGVMREVRVHRRGIRSAQALASALPYSSVTSIHLGDNHIGDTGAQTLASALPNSKVTWIDLGGNRIGDVGAMALASALPNSKVTYIDLAVNHIGAELQQTLRDLGQRLKIEIYW